MGQEGVSELRYALRRTDYTLERRELGSGTSLFGLTQPLDQPFSLGVHLIQVFVVREFHLVEDRLVEDSDGCPVVDCLRVVVGVDRRAEDGEGVARPVVDWGAGEGDERGVGERVSQMAGEAILEVIVATVRLVDDDDDVSTVREQGMPGACGLLRLADSELVERGEDDTAAALAPGEEILQLVAVVSLFRQAADGSMKAMTCVERVEELSVEVDPVGDEDDCRKGQPGETAHLAGVEEHLLALTGALRVPDDARLAVRGGCGAGGGEGRVDGDVLVGLGELHRVHAAAGTFGGVGEKAGDQSEEVVGFECPGDHPLQGPPVLPLFLLLE